MAGSSRLPGRGALTLSGPTGRLPILSQVRPSAPRKKSRDRVSWLGPCSRMVTARMLFEGICGQRAAAGWRRTTVPWRLALQACRRLGWGVADQAVSSITNFAVNIYIARDLGAVQYGAFALAYVTYGFALNASRGLATDPLLVRFSGADFQVWRRAVMNCTGTALLVGLVTGACVLLAARPLGGAAEPAFLALGLTLPGLLLQDSWRFAFFALGRGSRAFINDVIWAVTLLPALVLLRWSGHADVFWFVLAWGTAGSVAAAIGPLQAGLVPRLSGAPAWLSRQRDLGPRYTAEGTANSAAAQLRTYSLGIILGLAALGYVQAASTLMGPIQILIYGMGLVALPEAARILCRTPKHMPLFCGLISAGLALLGLSWGIVLMVALPRGLGHWLLGSMWRPAYPLILPTTLYFTGMCVAVGGGIWLHALAAARRSLRAAVINAAAIIVISVLGAVVQGTAGSIRGAALGTWTGAFVCWWQVHAALKETSGAPEADPLQPGRRAGKRRLRIGERKEPRASRLARPDVPGSARIKPGDHPFLWAALRRRSFVTDDTSSTGDGADFPFRTIRDCAVSQAMMWQLKGRLEKIVDSIDVTSRLSEAAHVLLTRWLSTRAPETFDAAGRGPGR